MKTLRESTSERARRRTWVGVSSGAEGGEDSEEGLMAPLRKGDVIDLNHELRFDVLTLEGFSSGSVLWRTRSGDFDEVRWNVILRGSFSLCAMVG